MSTDLLARYCQIINKKNNNNNNNKIKKKGKIQKKSCKIYLTEQERTKQKKQEYGQERYKNEKQKLSIERDITKCRK